MDIERTLTENGLKKTSSRIAILALFKKKKYALSYTDFEHLVALGFDKTTIYRTLYSFEEAGLIHKVDDHSGLLKYAFSEVKQNGHPHFSCEKCHNTYCLETTSTMKLELPKGFTSNQISTVVTGLCPFCYEL